MSRGLWVILPALLLSLGGLARADEIGEKRYTLDALDLLSQRNQWSEVIFHAQEIFPADRGARWEGIVSKAAVANIDFLIDSGASGASSIALALERTFPFLRNSKPYRQARERAAVAQYSLCFEMRSPAQECDGKLREALESTRPNPDFAFRAGVLVAGRHSPLAALPFFQIAVMESAPVSTAYCLRKELRDAWAAGNKLNPPRGPASEIESLRKACAFPAHAFQDGPPTR